MAISAAVLTALAVVLVVGVPALEVFFFGEGQVEVEDRNQTTTDKDDDFTYPSSRIYTGTASRDPVLEIEAYINSVLDRAMREIDRKNRHDRYLEVPELGNLYNIQNMRLTKLAFAKYEALTRRGTSIYDASSQPKNFFVMLFITNVCIRGKVVCCRNMGRAEYDFNCTIPEMSLKAYMYLPSGWEDGFSFKSVEAYRKSGECHYAASLFKKIKRAEAWPVQEAVESLAPRYTEQYIWLKYEKYLYDQTKQLKPD